MSSDLLQSYEKDFQVCMDELQRIVQTQKAQGESPADFKGYQASHTQQVYSDSMNLLKNMEIEGMNFMEDDQIRKRICKHKNDFDKIRKEVRRLQELSDRHSLQKGDIELGEFDQRQTRELLQNRRNLEEAKAVGYECEEMARDIKYNLQGQTDKLQNSTLKNLYKIQKETVMSSRLVRFIAKERLKNKLVLYGVLSIISLALLFIIYSLFF